MLTKASRLVMLLGWLVLGPVPGAGQFGSVLSAVERAEIALETDPLEAKAICDSLNKLNLSDLERAYVNFTLSDTYYYLEDIRGSSRAAVQALAVMPSNFPVAKQITLYNSQGQNYDILGKADSAIWCYKQGLVLAKQANDSLELSDLYYNLGAVYNTKMNYDKALSYLDSSYQIDFVLKDSIKLSNVLRTIGYMQMHYYDYAAAKKQLLQALRYANSDDPAQACVVLTTLGTLHEQQDQIDSLRKYWQLAKACYGGIEDQTTLHYLYKLQGEYYLLTADSLRAKMAFDSSGLLAASVGDQEGRIMANLQSLELSKATVGKLDQIEALLQEADNLDIITVLHRGYELYANQLEQAEQYEAALAARKKAANFLTTYNQSKNQRMVQGQSVRFDLFQKEQQIDLAKEKLKIQQSQWLAVLLSVLVFAGGLFGWFRYRVKKKELLQRQQQLEKETELQLKITEIESQAFRAQMNPHFIFNALNSVKGLIVTGRDKEAAVYISRFSKLVRSVLDQSRSKTISLAEELSTLELYLKLEQFRFRDGFDFQIEVEDGLHTEEIMMPAVIIQPFAENSIWHGFKGNQRENRLVIRVSTQDDKQLVIHVEDNGVGRPLEHDENAKDHTSHGVTISRQRLSNFAQSDTGDFVVYTDLGEDDNRLGTKVTLQLPLRYA